MHCSSTSPTSIQCLEHNQREREIFCNAFDSSFRARTSSLTLQLPVGVIIILLQQDFRALKVDRARTWLGAGNGGVLRAELETAGPFLLSPGVNTRQTLAWFQEENRLENDEWVLTSHAITQPCLARKDSKRETQEHTSRYIWFTVFSTALSPAVNSR